jgi:hypothetical protein
MCNQVLNHTVMFHERLINCLQSILITKNLYTKNITSCHKPPFKCVLYLSLQKNFTAL